MPSTDYNDVVIRDADGNRYTFSFVACTYFEGAEYIALRPKYSDTEASEISIFRIYTSDNEDIIESVDDERILSELTAIFKR